MANTNSTIVANMFTTPRTFTVAGASGGRVRAVVDNFEVAAANIDADGDTVRLASLPANARVIGIFLGGDDLDGSTDLSWNIGIYEPGTADAPGALIDEDAFASAITMQAVRDLGAANLITEALADGSALWTKFGKPLWDVAGDAQGDFERYEIVLTQTTAASSAAAGTIAYMILYVLD